MAFKVKLSFRPEHEDKINQILSLLKPFTKGARIRRYSDEKSNKRIHITIGK